MRGLVTALAFVRPGLSFLGSGVDNSGVPRWISGVAIFPCAGNRDEASERALAGAFAKGGIARRLAPGADQGSCSRSRASKNARSATLPAALAVRSDQNMPPRSRAGNGWPLRKISHSHGSREWPRWTTTTLYSSLPGGRLMGVCHALRSDECYRRLAALLRCTINWGIMFGRCYRTR